MRDVMLRVLPVVFVAVSAWLGTGCGRTSTTASKGSSTTGPEAYVPGLGEMMSFQQMRHAKLWFAGKAENWDLAAYELDELAEGFDDIVKFHPTHKDSPVAPKDAIPRMVNEPLKELRAAVEKKDSAAFVRGYETFTTACNTCHQATNFSFNAVQTPSTNSYSNQVFAPARR
jgi:mono/diheme cytochrome c family protein